MQEPVRSLLRAAIGLAVPFTLFLFLILLLAGCSSGTKTVTVPAQDRTVNLTVSDTLRLPQLPPLRPGEGERTLPGSTVVYRERPAGPLLPVRLFEVDRTPPGETIRVQYVAGGRTVVDSWPLPAYGETWRWTPQAPDGSRSGAERGRPGGRHGEAPDTSAQEGGAQEQGARRPGVPWDSAGYGLARIIGEPQAQQVQGKCPPCLEGWFGLKNEAAVLGLLVVVLGLGGGALKIFASSIVPF
jgi:hypothetical protein